MKKALIVLSILCVVSVLSVAFLYVSLADVLSTNKQLEEFLSKLLLQYEKLSMDYSSLLTSYDELNVSYQSLMKHYNELQSTYVRLMMDYASLNANYTSILTEFKVLNASYVELVRKYRQMEREYDTLYDILYKPLENENVPTIDELKAWLKEDPTNIIQYRDPDFVCGDFATMLSFHAKLRGWDMGVVAVFGHDAGGKKFNHAFNAIACAEGVVYVEAQTDAVWWNENYEEIVPGRWYEFPGFGRIYVEQYAVVVLYR